MDFNELNSIFRASNWLEENFGCEFYSTSGGFLNSSCPFDDHQDTSPSFGINIEKGFFKCFGCGREGSFITLVAGLLGASVYHAALAIAEYENVSVESSDTLASKHEKFKKSLIEVDEKEIKLKKLIHKATIKVKKMMKEDFNTADEVYKKIDECVAKNDYTFIKEFLNG